MNDPNYRRKRLYSLVLLGFLISCTSGLRDVAVDYSDSYFEYPNYCCGNKPHMTYEYLDKDGNPTSEYDGVYKRIVFCQQGRLIPYPMRSYRYSGVSSDEVFDSVGRPLLMHGKYTVEVDFRGKSHCFQEYFDGFLLESKYYNSDRDTFIYEYYNWQTLQSQFIGIGRWGDTVVNQITFADSGLVGSWEDFYGDSIMSYGVAPDSVVLCE